MIKILILLINLIINNISLNNTITQKLDIYKDKRNDIYLLINLYLGLDSTTNKPKLFTKFLIDFNINYIIINGVITDNICNDIKYNCKIFEEEKKDYYKSYIYTYHKGYIPLYLENSEINTNNNSYKLEIRYIKSYDNNKFLDYNIIGLNVNSIFYNHINSLYNFYPNKNSFGLSFYFNLKENNMNKLNECNEDQGKIYINKNTNTLVNYLIEKDISNKDYFLSSFVYYNVKNIPEEEINTNEMYKFKFKVYLNKYNIFSYNNKKIDFLKIIKQNICNDSNNCRNSNDLKQKINDNKAIIFYYNFEDTNKFKNIYKIKVDIKDTYFINDNKEIIFSIIEDTDISDDEIIFGLLFFNNNELFTNYEHNDFTYSYKFGLKISEYNIKGKINMIVFVIIVTILLIGFYIVIKKLNIKKKEDYTVQFFEDKIGN